MHEEAGSVQLVSGERIGGGLASDGMGELSKLLLGREPRRALRARPRHRRARRAAAGVRAGGRLRPGEPLPRPHGRRAHVRRRPGDGRPRHAAARAAGDAVPRSRQAARRLARTRRAAPLLRAAGNRDHADVGAELADAALRRLRYPTDLRERVVRDRPLPHVQHRQGRHAARAAAAGALRRGALARPARPQGGRPARQGPRRAARRSTSSNGCGATARSSSRSGRARTGSPT